ncbi:putative glutamate receptor isoform X2 [Tachypleus tridentatus]
MALSDFSITPSRDLAVDFTYPYYVDYVNFIVKAPSEKPRYIAIIRPFTLEVWIAILVSVIVTAVILSLLTKMSFVPQSENWTVSQTIWYFFGALTQQGGAEHIPQKGTVRMVVSAFWAFAIIIMAGFSGTLTSFINVPGFNKAVDNIPDLVQKIQVGEYKAGTVEGSSILKILSDATQGYLFNIGQAMKADPKNSVVRSIQQGVNETIYRNYALVFTKAPMEAEVAALGISRFRFSTDQFFSAYYAIAIPTGSPMKELLDVFVFKCMEAGLVEFWKKQILDKNTIKSFFSNKEATLPADTKVPASVSVTDMQGAFIILGAGYILGIFCFFLEVIIDSILNKKHVAKTKETNNFQW